jgi:hypothetical protein
MQTLEVFHYKNILNVQVIDPAIYSTRNRIVYSRTIKIYQGIDNPIHVVAKNQDQKSVNLTGYQMQVSIEDQDNAENITTFTVDFVNVAKGLGKFVVPRAVVNSLELRHYHLTARLIDGIFQESPLYIDDNYGAAVPLQVLPAYYPLAGFGYDGAGAGAEYQEFDYNIDGGGAATVYSNQDTLDNGSAS